MDRFRFSIGAAVAASCLGCFAMIATAQEPAGVIEYRQAVMSAQAGHMGALARIVRGEADFPEDVPAHARALHDLADMILPAFPEGSLEGAETDALPAIWEDWEGFSASVEEFRTATAALVAAADGGDAAAVGAAFGEVGNGCRSCHDDFRAE